MSNYEKSIYEILEKVTPTTLKKENIYINMNLFEDICLTSFDLLQVIYLIEVKFKIKISMSDFANVTTVEGLIELVKGKKANESA